ncbi:hypothetical protein PHET_05962 [Paragonimus heterotremus]|uniref:Uncharacterized protein n=1 Tax=Paragonimus heterotremus TaxID=100268 RepID=A0A8J4WGX5_9TREM|nr:hypothetical protein PHET_05962 [Paragonimus heterotremus]
MLTRSTSTRIVSMVTKTAIQSFLSLLVTLDRFLITWFGQDSRKLCNIEFVHIILSLKLPTKVFQILKWLILTTSDTQHVYDEII